MKADKARKGNKNFDSDSAVDSWRWVKTYI